MSYRFILFHQITAVLASLFTYDGFLLNNMSLLKYFEHIPKEKSDSECFHKGNYCKFFNI